MRRIPDLAAPDPAFPPAAHAPGRARASLATLRRPWVRALCAAAPIWLLAAGASAEDAWERLDALRAALEEAPLSAEFAQLYQPAGFSSGESESGRLSLDLPACVRWDYLEPFPKSYLLCGATAWTWNEGEAAGRRYFVDAAEEPGLDLLRLRVDELRRRYRAALVAGAEGRHEIRLEPLEGDAVRDATLVTDAAGRRLLALAYHDREGNLTRFDFSSYRALAERGRFAAPDLEWLER